MKPAKQMTKAELLALLRQHTVMRCERGDKLVGYRCGLCRKFYRGRQEKHTPECALSQ